MPFFDPIRIGASVAADTAYTVDRSLRFNRSDSAYLTKSLGSTSNRRTFTYSFWVKRTVQDAEQCLIYNGHPSSTPYGEIRFEYQGSNIHELNWYSYDGSHQFQIRTNRVFRDPSAWYHIVLALDTTQSTQSDRVKIYVNGEQETTFTTATYPSQDVDTAYNVSGNTHSIGGFRNTSNSFDGYVAEFNFIDGQQLTPSSFAETDAITGQWNPKKYVGSYGTNGFYLNFSDNSGTTATTLGKDSSGNSNNFTPNNFSVAAGSGNDSVEDTPTNNWCTLNPLASIQGNVTTSNGNLDASFGTVSGGGGIASSFVVRSGKWYWEITIAALSGASIHIGILDENIAPFSSSPFYNPGLTAESYAYQNNGTKYNNNTNTSYGASYTTNDVIGVALDLDNGTITFYKNNSSQGQAFSGLTGGFSPAIGDGSSAGTHSISANFGQRAFAYTPPTGYEALNSTNLPDPTIKLPNKHFGILTYTGDGSASRTISDTSSVNFTPDWVWAKNRSQADWHILSDAVRGFDGKTLYSNRDDVEYDASGSGENGYISAAANGGFVATDSDGSVGDNLNANSENYVAWNWNAGGSTVSNSDGSIASSVRANTTAGFSIATYTGTGSNTTIGHGLGVKPDFVILKRRTGGDSDWFIFHKDLGNTKSIRLNLNDAAYTIANIWNNTDPTSSVVNIGDNSAVNANGSTYVMYCFSEVAGYSKFGSYTGFLPSTGNGSFVYLGFRPAYLIVKKTESEFMLLTDSKRGVINPIDERLFPAWNYAESDEVVVDFLSNGFKARNGGGASIISGSGSSYIYWAFAESPFKYSRAR